MIIKSKKNIQQAIPINDNYKYGQGTPVVNNEELSSQRIDNLKNELKQEIIQEILQNNEQASGSNNKRNE